MKPLLLFFLLLGATAGRAQAPTSVRLPLRAVTLYQNGAELHHRAEVSLPAGPAELRVTGLSPYLAGSSVQAEAGGAELEDVQLVPAGPAGGAVPGTLTDSLRTARQALRRLQAEETTLAAEADFLRENKTLERITPGRWVEEARRAATAYAERLGALTTQQADVREQLTTQSTLVQALSQRAGLLPATAGPAQTVLLRLSLARAGTVRLDVSYQLLPGNQSGWVPEYDLRVHDSDLDHLRVVSRARLANYTGLPWQAVPVDLRTSAPAADIRRPSLADPWSVSDTGSLTDAEEETTDGPSSGEGRLDNFAVKGQARSGGASGSSAAPDLGARLALSAPVTLPVSGSRSYQLAEQRLPLRLEYLAIPKRDEQAYLIGRVTDWGQVNFLAESAKVFYRGAYVGETEVDTRAFADTLEVSLGRDPQVQLTRTKREDFESTVFSLGGNRRRTRLAYEINVKNTHPYPVRLRLLDQVPISQDKDIEVKVQDSSGAVHDEPSGRLTWQLTLPPGDSRRFRTAFTVEAPANRRQFIRHSRRVKSPKFR